MARRGDICEGFNNNLLEIDVDGKYKSRKSFARVVGKTEKTISNWILGRTKPPWGAVIRIAKIFNRSPREYLQDDYKIVYDAWIRHLMKYLLSPPEVKNQTKVEVKIEGANGTETKSTTKTERLLKLDTKDALVLTEKLGFFDAILKQLGEESVSSSALLNLRDMLGVNVDDED